MINVKPGDVIILKNGEEARVSGFFGRGHNALVCDLAPSSRGRKRMAIVRAKDIKEVRHAPAD